MYRILIVDDEPMALYSTAHTFPWADWGFDPPVLMTEAPAALDKLRAERFDAAIVDIRMPQMTGIDLIRLSGEAGLQTVFIVLSGYSDFSYVQTALRLSTFDYCLKPILPDAAQAALERLSGRIHDIRVGSDPAFLATLSSTAPLKPLFTQRGLPVPEGMEEYLVPATTYAVFECIGAMPDAIQKLQQRMVAEWLPTSGYEYAPAPDIEVYPEGDQQADTYYCEAWLPIIKK